MLRNDNEYHLTFLCVEATMSIESTLNITLFFDYLLRCLPAFCVVGAYFVLVPRRFVELRLLGSLLAFFVLRDAMTPVGLWSLGTEGGFWLRVLPETWLGIVVGVACVAIVVLMNRIDRPHLELPFADARMLRDLLRQEGHKVGCSMVARLMRLMGIEALHRKHRSTKSIRICSEIRR